VGAELWVFVVVGAGVLLVGLVVFVVPVLRAERRPAASAPPAPVATTRTGSLLRGFGYLYEAPEFARRTRSVGHRLQRAFDRIEAVDPNAAPRRIGLALLQGFDQERDLG